jgi:hypothetical protein
MLTAGITLRTTLPITGSEPKKTCTTIRARYGADSFSSILGIVCKNRTVKPTDYLIRFRIFGDNDER